MKKYDPFENVQTVMEQAAILGKIDRRMFEIIKNPQRETKVYLPVEMDGCSRAIVCSTPISAARSRVVSVTTRTAT